MDTWTSWSAAQRAVEQSGLQGSDLFPFVLVDWLEAGALESVALSAFFGNRHEKNAPIPKRAWAAARRQMGGVDFGGEGALKAEWTEPDEDAPYRVSLKVRGILVNSAQLAELAPFGTADRPDAEERRSPGAPPKVAHWHRFWLEIVRLADDGKLRSFGTQKELRAHLLQTIDDKLSDESICPHVSDVWHRVLKL